MHPIRVADAAWVFAATTEPSKVPFYIAGALLACWAFGVAAAGIARPDLARSARAGRLVILTSAILAAATVTTAVITAGAPTEEHDAQTAATQTNTLRIAADPTGDSAYDRTTATVSAGQLTVRFANDSPVPHNVTIARGARVVAATSTIHDGRTTATADLPAGDYVFYCSVDGHRQAGMRGTLTAR
ncbi:plastocyanin/azurin family copper-binding protein [Conexibacter woesei]|uniref:Blue (Type 1) copper domain protein n=1 Tax=Conexibacter woesei (strain DSM 14684 / CCUG 47730 / CIP 108061 / JCM 11494 / NBRC 100937 / ID131577) TaxID=469383 RepID=D3FF77_CONWI|nr:plastocyanin/azurin family copper-binding protein [Conexibacter woesei]ADB51794.1 blue (type 1) copper domain protein [Conexibacter woesei DSM 14684]